MRAFTNRDARLPLLALGAFVAVCLGLMAYHQRRVEGPPPLRAIAQSKSATALIDSSRGTGKG